MFLLASCLRKEISSPNHHSHWLVACPGDMAQDPGLAGAMWVLPSCKGGGPTSPCRSCPKSRGSDSRPQKPFPLMFWCFEASITLNRSSSLAYSSTSPTRVLKPFDKFQNETHAPSTEQEQSSHFKLGRPCTISGLSDTINIR